MNVQKLKNLFNNDRVFVVDSLTFEHYVWRRDVRDDYLNYPWMELNQGECLEVMLDYLGMSSSDCPVARTFVTQGKNPLLLVEGFFLPRFTVKGWKEISLFEGEYPRLSEQVKHGHL